MRKATGVILMLFVTVCSTVFSDGLKRERVESPAQNKLDTSHFVVALIKCSLQECKPAQFNLSEDKLRGLYDSSESGDGNACWQLTRYFYCNDQVDKYIYFIKKGCELNDPDCLYEIIDNCKNQIPCTRDEKDCFNNQLKLLGESGVEDAQRYWNLLNDEEE